LWGFLEPVFREGTTYVLDPSISELDAKEFWLGGKNKIFVAEVGGELVGSYILRPNQSGPGSHVCNCGYITSQAFRGQGIASSLCDHSQVQAIEQGYLAMQFNFVVSTNEGAIRLWKHHGFKEVGRLPKAFQHPQKGLVDAIVMHKWLKT
jgi:ribosomal protein S18 acetylase RimI-like enzyme